MVAAPPSKQRIPILPFVWGNQFSVGKATIERNGSNASAAIWVPLLTDRDSHYPLSVVFNIVVGNDPFCDTKVHSYNYFLTLSL